MTINCSVWKIFVHILKAYKLQTSTELTADSHCLVLQVKQKLSSLYAFNKPALVI